MESETRARTLRARVRTLTWLFMVGLFLSGVTALPLVWEAELGAKWLGVDEPGRAEGGVSSWVGRVRDALIEMDAKHPFLAYGTDWLAFGHFAIAIAFWGAVRDPVRNAWLFQFGMIACLLVIPYALVCGQVRGIPLWWRLVDCSFGVFGFFPVFFCHRAARELERMERGIAS